MFVLLSILVSAAILGFMYHNSQTKETRFRLKYDLISDLRQMVYYCRQHRTETHKALIYGNSATSGDQIAKLETSILDLADALIDKAKYDNKPVYRILQVRIKKLFGDWEEMSIGQNQMAHGKTIRHCLFLVDEIMLAWLIEKQRTDLSERYNKSWQQIIDALEALTRFRMTIADIETDSGYSLFKTQAISVNRRVNQLALVSPLAISSPACALATKQLDEIIETEEISYSQEQLYKISSDISLIVFNAYDNMLETMAETIYEPFPKLAVAV